jgi:predicted nucleic acid-binding Zn ribbon protein
MGEEIMSSRKRKGKAYDEFAFLIFLILILLVLSY